MKIGRILYGLNVDAERVSDILAMVQDMRAKCPAAEQFWLKDRREENLHFAAKESPAASRFMEKLSEYGIEVVDYGSQEELKGWLEELAEKTEKAQPPKTYDLLDREGAEWTNLSVTLPAEETENRILLVGDSISAGYGDMVQKRMPGRRPFSGGGIWETCGQGCGVPVEAALWNWA